MVSILSAVEWFEDARPLRSVIYSDSRSSLASLQDSRPHNLIEIQQTLRSWYDGAYGHLLGYQRIMESGERQTGQQRTLQRDFQWIWLSVLVGLILRGEYGRKWKKGENERKRQWFHKIQMNFQIVLFYFNYIMYITHSLTAHNVLFVNCMECSVS